MVTPDLPERPIFPDPLPSPGPNPEPLEVIGSQGADTLRGKGGTDKVWVRAGNGGRQRRAPWRIGSDRITDFSTATDRIRLDAALWAGRLNEARVVERYAHDTGDDVVFDFGEGDTLTLDGVAGVSGLADVIDII